MSPKVTVVGISCYVSNDSGIDVKNGGGIVLGVGRYVFVMQQGLFLLNGPTSYRKISWRRAARLDVMIIVSLWIWQASRQPYCRGAFKFQSD